MKILLAEDETDLANAIKALLIHSGYSVDLAEDGQYAVDFAAQNGYDAMVFDIMMPRKDGLEALREIRAAGDTTPVIMLTAKSEIEDRITGLDSGADDYLTKPFAMAELLARLRAMTRRARPEAASVITYANIEVDPSSSELRAVSSISLAFKELKLLELLVKAEGKVITTEEIYDRIWQDDPDTSTKIVLMYISYLKNKLRSVGASCVITGSPESGYTLTEG